MTRQYFWLNANPKYWCFHKTPVGTPEDYTIYNEDGNKRFIFKCFVDAKVGDIVIGYQGSPNKQILAIYKITREVEDPTNKEEYILLTKYIDLPNGVSRDDLINYGLTDIMPLRNVKGSLFPLDINNYLSILELIEEKNPGLLDDCFDEEYTLDKKIELLDVEKAVKYAKDNGTYYLGWSIPVGIEFSEEEVKTGLLIKKVADGFQQSLRDNSKFLISKKISHELWSDSKHFSFGTTIDCDNELVDDPIPEYYNVDKYVHVLYETENNKYKYLGIAEITVQETLLAKPEENNGSYRYDVTFNGSIL